MDDDREVLDFGRTALTRKGYRVLAASSLNQAEAAMADKSRIDPLIADTVLPRRIRNRVAERFTSGHPEAKTFYISGYVPPDLPESVITAMREGNFLQKPFDAEELSRQVRRVLNR